MLDELLTVLGALHDPPEIRVVASPRAERTPPGGDRREFAGSLAATARERPFAPWGTRHGGCVKHAATSAVTIARPHGG